MGLWDGLPNFYRMQYKNACFNRLGKNMHYKVSHALLANHLISKQQDTPDAPLEMSNNVHKAPVAPQEMSEARREMPNVHISTGAASNSPGNSTEGHNTKSYPSVVVIDTQSIPLNTSNSTVTPISTLSSNNEEDVKLNSFGEALGAKSIPLLEDINDDASISLIAVLGAKFATIAKVEQETVKRAEKMVDKCATKMQTKAMQEKGMPKREQVALKHLEPTQEKREIPWKKAIVPYKGPEQPQQTSEPPQEMPDTPNAMPDALPEDPKQLHEALLLLQQRAIVPYKGPEQPQQTSEPPQEMPDTPNAMPDALPEDPKQLHEVLLLLQQRIIRRADSVESID